MQLGLKIGSKDITYTEDIFTYYEHGYFQYIELFTNIGSFEETIGYWKQFSIPIVIHAPHSGAGMNLSLPDDREKNKKILLETLHFANDLNVEYIIFHSGVNGTIEETMYQLRPFIDSRFLVENKPIKGLKNEKCIGSTPDEIILLAQELKTGFCLDFGHAICAANSLQKDPLVLINEFIKLHPAMYHLTDGDYTSEYDSHLHYGKGNYPIKKLLSLIPVNVKLTNEARHDSLTNLNDFKEDSFFLCGMLA